MKSLLLLQNPNCCGSRQKDETGWKYDLFYDLCPTRFLGIDLYPSTRQHYFSVCPSLQILTMDEVNKIGKISKQWTGLLREAFTDSDNFGIQFPMDLDVKMKAVMIGACFLIVSIVICFL